jgi:hypothetical protein
MGWIKDNVQAEIADYLFNIKVSLPDRVGTYQRDIVPDLEIDFDQLEEQLTETPEMICFFDMLLAEQKAKVAALEQRLFLVRGQVTEKILNEWKNIDREIRRSDLKDLVVGDDEVVNIQAQLIVETKKEDKLKAVFNGLLKKSEHLRSLAGFKREERKNP